MKFWAVFLIVSFGFSSTPQEVKKTKRELQEKQRILKEVRTHYRNLKTKENLLKSQEVKLKTQLIDTQLDIRQTCQKIKETQWQIIKTQQQISNTEKLINQSNILLLESDILFDFKNTFPTLMTQEVISLLTKDSINELLELNDKKEEFQYQLVQHQEKKMNLTEKEKKLKKQQIYLNAVIENTKKEIKNAELRIKSLTKEVEKLKLALARLNQLIASYVKKTPSTTREKRSIDLSAVLKGKNFALPIQGEVTYNYGRFKHPRFGVELINTGVGIKGLRGAVVKSAESGKVIFSSAFGGWGKLVMIDHGDGLVTLYGNLKEVYVKSGQAVSKNSPIGIIGDKELHFEVRLNGKDINPMLVCR